MKRIPALSLATMALAVVGTVATPTAAAGQGLNRKTRLQS